ncbi:MAG: Holliday junction ATP-dependent DNA helicase RuvA [Candidatus Omnitrophica bacterium]|nr:Holliday junction ATP-dependent DNA helicase RuvA [Candidatus Omnitrophota bacterium]
MISRITGKVSEKGLNYLSVDVNGLCYEVFIPACVMQRVDEVIGPGGSISLITYHYHQVEPSKSTPVLIGFLNDIEKDFFQTFITVSGIGPRAALKALNKPISQIAQAIDEGDVSFLRSLPGIGEQRAKEIVAKLQNKVGRFGLIQDGKAKTSIAQAKGIIEEAIAVLEQLQYKKSEASAMIKKAMEIFPDAQTTEELLNIVYKQRKAK